MPTANDTPAPAATAQVLVVDDDASIRSMVQLMLSSEGYRVASAIDGQDALEQIVARRPDVVLLDLQMPVMSGWELLEALRERHIDVPVVVMTAAYRARAEAERHGAAGHLAKPFDIDDLLDVVARFAEPEG